MKVLRCIAIVLPILMAAAGCGRKESTRAVAPLAPSQEPQVIEAQWVMDRDALEGAIQVASASSLVRRVIALTPNVRLTRAYRYAVRAEGKLSGGERIGATVLPYIVDDDPTHAVFVSLLNRDGKEQAEASELIFGREPTALETGFRPVHIGDAIGWVKTGSTFVAGAEGLARLSPERFKWMRFIECLIDGAADACSAGAGVGSIVAPGVPYASAIGCGVGVALRAIGCAAGAM
jgi:hypothetical protein